jgi:hypothetical protein
LVSTGFFTSSMSLMFVCWQPPAEFWFCFTS